MVFTNVLIMCSLHSYKKKSSCKPRSQKHIVFLLSAILYFLTKMLFFKNGVRYNEIVCVVPVT